MFVRCYELGQGLQGLFGVLALRANGDLIALSGKPGYLQNALGVDFPIALHDHDLRGESLGRLYEPRRRAAVDPFLRPYRRLSLRHEKLLSRPRTLYKTRHTGPMIPSLALESGYGAGGCCSHEPCVRRDGDELETIPRQARGVLGRTCEDAGGKTVITCVCQHPFDSLDYRGLAAVRAWSMPEALAEVRGPHEDCVQALYTEYLIQVLQRLLRLDHGHCHDGLVRVVGVVLAAIDGCPVRAVTAVSPRRVAAGPDEGFSFFAGIDHRADHSVTSCVEHPHNEAGIIPRHPDDGHSVRSGDGLQHWDETSVIHGPVLHIYGQAIPSCVRHHFG